MNLTLVAGARPNFMKIAPLIRAIAATHGRIVHRLVHTGQHYDHSMNQVFFDELGIPAPDASLGCGGGSHAEQTAAIIRAFEAELLANRPEWVVVVGDVNSTLACAITAKKLGVSLAHVEAGLRSGDRSMPEEINRIVTDSISDLFFVTEPSGVDHLRREGQPEDRIHMVGHVMVDNLFFQVDRLRREGMPPSDAGLLKARMLQGPPGGGYIVVTLHRPSNVDDPAVLARIAAALRTVSALRPIVFPVHPRTRARLDALRIDLGPRVHLTGPLSYMDFLNIWMDADLVLTDSGGLQEETTALGVRCVTVREATERPVTITNGTNVLAGTGEAAIVAAVETSLARAPSAARPELWDGRAAERIVSILGGHASGS